MGLLYFLVIIISCGVTTVEALNGAEAGKKTPLYEEHISAGGRIVDFAGWLLPVQYTSIVEEHLSVRQKAGLFDVSHMGEIEVEGPDAFRLVQQLITHDASLATGNKVIYSPMCYPDGGTVDDILVYRLKEDKFLLVVNAANTAKDLEWIQRNVQERAYEVEVRDVSALTLQLALQGPKAESILQPLTDFNLQELGFYRWAQGRVLSTPCLISRTGYTGEDGFELYLDPSDGKKIWRELLTRGKNEGLRPCGLGARDTLRLEAALPLYGHELTPEITPLEAGLDRFVRVEKGDFNGREVLKKQKEVGPKRRLVGLQMMDRAIPRQGFPIFQQGREVGFITSGSFAPSLNCTIALGLVDTPYGQVGEEVEVLIRGHKYRAQVIPLPFYRRSR